MAFHSFTSDEWEQLLGRQIRELRLRQNVTQADVARRANIDRTTIGRIENGEGGSIGSLVKIVRALGREDWLNSFAPPAAAISPMQLLREQQHRETQQRRRARRPSTVT